MLFGRAKMGAARAVPSHVNEPMPGKYFGRRRSHYVALVARDAEIFARVVTLNHVETPDVVGLAHSERGFIQV